MSNEALLSFAMFALVTSITPGPNNILLMTSGVNHGFLRTVPHLSGVSIGFAILFLGTGLGLGELFTRLPVVYEVMRWVAIAYFLHLAWRLSTTSAYSDNPEAAHAPTAKVWRFHEGFAFQWINPKVWIMAIGAFSRYVPIGQGTGAIVRATIIFTVIGIPCSVAWVLFGSRMRRYLLQGHRRRVFNIGMATLLLASLAPLVGADTALSIPEEL